MLRLVIDTDGIDSEADPKIVYLGHSASAAQAAIDASASGKLSITEIPWLRRAKKTPMVELPPVVEEPPPNKGDGLDELFIEDMIGLADDEGIDISGCKLKQDYIDTIRSYRKLDDENDVASIKLLAMSEGVDFTGLKLKRDYINAIVAKRRLQNFP